MGAFNELFKIEWSGKKNGLTEKVNPNCPAEVTRLISVWGYAKLNGRAKNNGLTGKVSPDCPAEVTRLISVWGYAKLNGRAKK